jgi:hypothetical protein
MHASSQLGVTISTKYFYVSSCPATCSVDTCTILKEISWFNNNNNNNNNNEEKKKKKKKKKVMTVR